MVHAGGYSQIGLRRKHRPPLRAFPIHNVYRALKAAWVPSLRGASATRQSDSSSDFLIASLTLAMMGRQIRPVPVPTRSRSRYQSTGRPQRKHSGAVAIGQKKNPSLGQAGVQVGVIGCLVASRADELQLTIGHVVAASGLLRRFARWKRGRSTRKIGATPKRKGPGTDVGAKSNH